MSAEIQAKLNAGYIRIAAALGQSYKLYPFALLNPLDSANAEDTELNVAFSADPNFTAPLKYNKAVWICYGDRDRLTQFKFAVGPYGIFYIADRQPYQPMQAVRCNKRVNIGRLNYTQGGGSISSSVDLYAENIPVFMQFVREDIQKHDQTAGSTMGRAITHWTTFLPLPDDSLRQDDVVIDEDGINYTIDATNFTNMGYVAHLRLSTL